MNLWEENHLLYQFRADFSIALIAWTAVHLNTSKLGSSIKTRLGTEWFCIVNVSSPKRGVVGMILQGCFLQVVEVWHPGTRRSAKAVPILAALWRHLVRIGGPVAAFAIHNRHMPAGLHLSWQLEGLPVLGL